MSLRSVRRLVQPACPIADPCAVPSFGLHAAAATGNMGLVEYALARGQPVNSVLDGVLPLHAACAGGSEPVVKLLIDHGADVNGPRPVSFCSSLASTYPSSLPADCPAATPTRRTQ